MLTFFPGSKLIPAKKKTVPLPSPTQISNKESFADILEELRKLPLDDTFFEMLYRIPPPPDHEAWKHLFDLIKERNADSIQSAIKEILFKRAITGDRRYIKGDTRFACGDVTNFRADASILACTKSDGSLALNDVSKCIVIDAHAPPQEVSWLVAEAAQQGFDYPASQVPIEQPAFPDLEASGINLVASYENEGYKLGKDFILIDSHPYFVWTTVAKDFLENDSIPHT